MFAYRGDVELFGHLMSEWTSEFFHQCEKAAGRELDEDEMIMALDWAFGYAAGNIDVEASLGYAGVEVVNELEDDDYSDDEDEDVENEDD